MNSLRDQCGVCPHKCMISQGSIGLCGARGNVEGAIEDLNYGQCTSLALDPIEKKPLALFHPGSLVLSYGSYGCNLKCRFCQNSDISMADAKSALARRTTYIGPEELVGEAEKLKSRGNIGIALTYNEPLIAPEYLHDVGQLVHAAGMFLAVVTNGYCAQDVFSGLLPFVDAMNIDLKCFSEEGYRKVGAPRGLETVKANIKAAADAGVHVELTTLVVPGLSDNEAEFVSECEWIASVNPSIPLHLSRFFPQYKMMDEKPTDIAILERFAKIARGRLEHVYLGNV